jgi:hypothetical protein
MSLIVQSNRNNPSGKQYEIPDEGGHPGTLIQVRDLGTVETKFGPRPRVRLVWELDALASDGRHLRAYQAFNKSFDSKSYLRKAVRQILGHDPGDTFDLESLVGLHRLVVIGHDDGPEGRIFANIRAVLPLREEGGAA